MSLIVQNRIALGNINDLTVPTSTQQYKLGTIVTIEDTDKTSVKVFKYVKSHTALTAYQPYIITHGATAGSEVITAAPAALTSAVVEVCWPQVAFTSGYYGWVQIRGNLTSAVTATTSTVAGYAFTLAAAGTTLVNSGAATRTAGATPTVAYLVTATSGATASVCAAGLPVIITT